MIATSIIDLLERIRKGTFDPIDTKTLEQAPADELVEELRSRFPVTFQERRIGNKREVSLARSMRGELVLHPITAANFVSLAFVPVYRNCLMLSIEDNRLTGLSRLSRLTVRGTRKPQPGLALKSGHGFKLDKTPDGWAIKPMRRRTVKLSSEFLQGRGWKFDHLKQLIPMT